MEIEEEYGMRLSPRCPESSQNNALKNKACVPPASFEFNLDLNLQHALTFIQKKKTQFDAKWSENPEGNPAYNGWLMVLSCSQEAFHQLEFSQQVYEEILKLCKKFSVVVLRYMGPVCQAVQKVVRA